MGRPPCPTPWPAGSSRTPRPSAAGTTRGSRSSGWPGARSGPCDRDRFWSPCTPAPTDLPRRHPSPASTSTLAQRRIVPFENPVGAEQFGPVVVGVRSGSVVPGEDPPELVVGVVEAKSGDAHLGGALEQHERDGGDVVVAVVVQGVPHLVDNVPVGAVERV